MNSHFKLIILTIWLLFSNLVSYAHNLKGFISGKDGAPIPYATVFIKEVSLGTITNENGKFELDLPPGVYTANFRSLGFIPKIMTIKLTGKETVIKVNLEEQIVQLSEVEIKGNGEDPAYPILRKVIGLSYVHLNQISSYSADVYIRGTVKFEKIPSLIRNQLKRKQIDIKTGDVLVNETVSLINFIAPDKYEQQIRSVNSTFPKVVDFSVNEFLGASLYQDNVDILFSPLSKNAFNYYNFRYEGFEKEGKYTINKIKVTPKKKSKQLFEGYIYIIEGLWCLHRADLKFETPFGDVSFRLVFDEVRPGVWLPVGHDYTFEGGMMGVKGSARFGASIKYNQLKVNDKVLAMIGIQPTNPDINKESTASATDAVKKSANQPVYKKELKIAHLLDKEKLNNRDMTRLSKLMAQQDKSLKPDSLKSLEIKDEVKVIVEKGANSRDTSYWAQMRPIPLSLDEINSFHQRDSLISVKKTQPSDDSNSVLSHKKNYGILNPIFFGIKKSLKDSTWHVKYDGLISTKRISFNAVDGWKLAQSIDFRKNYKPGKTLTITPYMAYAFNRRAILGTGTLNYTYSPLKRGSLEFSGGRNTLDFNSPNDVVQPFINSVASLFFKRNYGRYYENRFVNFSNSIDISNGLVLRTIFKWNNIKQLQNSTNISFVNKQGDYEPNLPANGEITAQSIKDQINTVAGLRIEYTPNYFYRINNGVKTMSNSNYPTFYVEYKKGIKQFLASVADFDFLGAGIDYGKEWSPTSSIAGELHAGWFPNNSSIHFSDFAHAQTQTSPILLKEYRHSFYLPSYYSLSTSDKFVEAHLSIKAPYIALKHLPLLSNTLWREMVWCSYYTSPLTRNYVEVGYTLLEVLLSANIGAFAGFDDGKFNTMGINLSFRISY